jgi:hypothetical protein
MCVCSGLLFCGLYFGLFGVFSSLSIVFLVLEHQMMDRVQKYTLINANTPSSEVMCILI